MRPFRTLGTAHAVCAGSLRKLAFDWIRFGRHRRRKTLCALQKPYDASPILSAGLPADLAAEEDLHMPRRQAA